MESMKIGDMNIIIKEKNIVINCTETNDELNLNLSTDLDEASILNKIGLKYNSKDLFYTHTFDVEDYLLENYPNNFKYTGSEEERY